MTDASQGEGRSETGGGDEQPLDSDRTLHLRVEGLRADETMQLRVPARPEPSSAGGRAERRRGTRPPGKKRVGGAAARALGPLAPYARRLKPAYPRPGRTGWRRWVPSWRQWLGGVLTSFGLLGAFLVTAYAVTDIPTDLNTYATQQDNVYFWSDGTPMARTGWVQRQAMPLKDIPPDVRWAVLAAENETFYSDPGISVKGISRALFRTVGEGDTQGGSTITQQYVKNVYLNQNQTVSRKFTEAMISLKLDNKMSKDKILEGYLNTSWFGRGTYGIQRAAQAYYGKDVSELNVSEAAMLAGLLKGAGLFDPTLSKANHQRAVERWSWILDRMVKIHKLSPQERATYTTFPEPLKSNPLYNTGEQSDYLVELASQYAKKAAHLTDQQFDLGGYQIYTTFDRKRENALTDAVTKARKQAKQDNPDAAKNGHYGAASVATDGRILAVYGGPDHRTQGYNESNATTVPAGSAFLPFVYAAGLEHGVHKTRGGPATPVTPDSVYDGDDGVPVTTPEGPYWDRSGKKVAAHNDGNRSYGKITLREALAKSVNTPFMQLGMDTGLAQVRQTAQAAGLLSSSIGPQVPALSLGSSTPSAIRMASGYATFAAGGTHTEPYSVGRITRNGAPVALATPHPARAVGTEVAKDVDQALTDSFRAAHPDVTKPGLSGKAGTADKDTAAWYAGTDDSVSTAVVLYRIDLAKSLEPLPLKGLAGSSPDNVPYRLWSAAMGLD
ncbi:Membrane carboxypeptidase (penicillin-binding protein) [Streptomyces misionensis]|uniref:Membrane carboxypeptidase (Penicillin-binding protein) n=1 Tax=Streptomyces misionensis TaxID=67331 RepID=A0A1H4V221_9ACTN|nr:Membrane carboxypeptidase (penicillin-binding protein) [Streptomyces misionensis]